MTRDKAASGARRCSKSRRKASCSSYRCPAAPVRIIELGLQRLVERVLAGI